MPPHVRLLFAFVLALLPVCLACTSPKPTGLPATYNPYDVQYRAADDIGVPVSATPVEVAFDPSSTDPAVHQGLEAHLAIVRPGGSATTQQLVVLLPGTGRSPKEYRGFLHEAALLGHHALGLAYANAPALSEACGSDLACYELARHETFDGQDRTAKVSVKYADSVESRLVHALLHLAQTAASDGWGTYLTGGKPDWSKVVLAGHSHGAGQAAFVAKLKAVSRVALLAGPVDGHGGQPAAWLNSVHATPGLQFFALAHAGDATFAQVSANWTALGLGGKQSQLNVDEVGPPFVANLLVATKTCADPHACIVIDGQTPLADDGRPLYRHAWKQLTGY